MGAIKKQLASQQQTIFIRGTNSAGSVSEVCLLWSAGIYTREHFLRAFLMSQNLVSNSTFSLSVASDHVRLPRWEKLRGAEMPQIFWEK